MENSNIPGGDGISPGSFDIDLSKLTAAQVDPSKPEGSTEPDGQPIQVEIDPRYKGLPEAEAIARTVQSKYDKLNVDFINTQKELQSVGIYKDILADLYESDDAFMAFLTERKPELIQSRDIKTELTKALASKFGEGFKPELSRDEAERNDPGGKDWLYYRELDRVTNELLNGNGKSYSKHQSLKDFRAARKAEIDAENAKIEEEIQQTKEQLKMSDAEVEWNRKWSAVLKFKDLVEISRFLRKFQNTPAMGKMPGSSGEAMSRTRQDFLNSLKH